MLLKPPRLHTHTSTCAHTECLHACTRARPWPHMHAYPAQTHGLRAVLAGLSHFPVSHCLPRRRPPQAPLAPPEEAPSVGGLVGPFCLIIKPTALATTQLSNWLSQGHASYDLQAGFTNGCKPRNHLGLKPATEKLRSLGARFGGDFWRRELLVVGPVPGSQAACDAPRPTELLSCHAGPPGGPGSQLLIPPSH